MSSTSGMSSNDSATCSTSTSSASHSMNRSPRDSHSKRVDSCISSLSPGESLSHKASLSSGGEVSEGDFTSHPHLFADGVDMLDHLTLSSLHNTLELLPGWHNHSTKDFIQLCKIDGICTDLSQPLVITVTVTVDCDRKWKLFVHNRQVKKCSALCNIPVQLDRASFKELIVVVDKLHVCAGHPDSSFLVFADSRRGKFIGKDGSITAFVDDYAPITTNGEIFLRTVRTSNCELLVHDQKCKSCIAYRRTLRVLHSRWSVRNSADISSSSSHTNNRYLNTPEKCVKISKLKQRVKIAESEVVRLKEKVLNMLEKSGEEIDEGLHGDLSSIVQEKSEDIHTFFPEGTFRRVFWDQQVKNSRKSDSRQYRWHPLMIKWCLNLKLLSSAAYHAMRTSGFITLPSERTLRDYTSYIKSVPGYQKEVIDMMENESKCKELPHSRRYVTILLDEMKIKEDIVYDKYSGNMIGFCNLGNLNDDLIEAERIGTDAHPPIAKQILTVMVRGVFFKFEFPLAHFSTEGITADLLFPIVWDGVASVESTGLKVIAITADGASPNRKFFRMHKTSKDKFVYKTKNLYAPDDREIYFFSDLPHLIKTSRNCLSHSSYFNTSRLMWVSYSFTLLCIPVYMCMNNYAEQWARHSLEAYP